MPYNEAELDVPSRRPLTLAAMAVKALLQHHQVPSNQQAKLLCDLLGVTLAPVHKKLNGTTQWTLEEIKLVADHFGEPLIQVISRLGGVSAEIRLREEPVPVQIWHDNTQENRANVKWVARKRAAGPWQVERHSSGETLTDDHVRIRFATLGLDNVMVPRIAVLDDELNTAEMLSTGLRLAGLTGVPYSEADVLVRDLGDGNFDGFIIDWALKKGSSLGLLTQLRKTFPSHPIAVLTGKMGTHELDARVFVDAIERLSLQFFQKPIGSEFIAAYMRTALKTKPN